MLNLNLVISRYGSLWYVMSGNAVFGVFATKAGAREAVRESRAAGVDLPARDEIKAWEGEGGHLRSDALAR